MVVISAHRLTASLPVYPAAERLTLLLPKGAVRRMRTRIRLLAQPESMRSIVGAIQYERWFD